MSARGFHSFIHLLGKTYEVDDNRYNNDATPSLHETTLIIQNILACTCSPLRLCLVRPLAILISSTSFGRLSLCLRLKTWHEKTCADKSCPSIKRGFKKENLLVHDLLRSECQQLSNSLLLVIQRPSRRLRPRNPGKARFGG